MISWTVQGSNEGATGSSSLSQSTANSYHWTAYGSGAAQGGVSFTYSGSGTKTASSVTTGETITDIYGETRRTFSSYSSSEEFSNQFSISTGSELGTETFTGETDTSGSQSGETLPTARLQTSTTATYASAYDAFYTISLEDYEDDEQEDVPVWTTSAKTISGETKTSVSFYTTRASSISSIEFSYLTRAATSDAVTTLDQTITLSAVPNTIVQAAPNEILYVISNPATAWNAYSAATDAAQSGTRFTLAPQINTVAKAMMASSAPTSSVTFPSYSTAMTYSVVQTSLVTVTTANYFYFPPQTGTRTSQSYSLASSSASASVASSSVLYGSGTTTVEKTEYITKPQSVKRQTETVTYSGLTSTSHSLGGPAAIHGAVTKTASYTFSNTVQNNLNILADGTRTNGESSGMTSHAEGNATIQKGVVQIANTPSYGRTKYRTSGAVVGSTTGGWITANIASSDSIFALNLTNPGLSASPVTSQGFFFLYALDGSGRNGNTVFPLTNSGFTVSSNSVTYATSTSNSAGSQKTTKSAEFGVSGNSSITTDAQPISAVGGYPGKGQTIVERPAAGVYKDRVGGSTTTFSQGDQSFTEGNNRQIASYFPIKNVGPLQPSTNANPVTWAEARNNIGLPPYT
jgi:hypothetical protein